MKPESLAKHMQRQVEKGKAARKEQSEDRYEVKVAKLVLPYLGEGGFPYDTESPLEYLAENFSFPFLAGMKVLNEVHHLEQFLHKEKLFKTKAWLRFAEEYRKDRNVTIVFPMLGQKNWVMTSCTDNWRKGIPRILVPGENSEKLEIMSLKVFLEENTDHEEQEEND